MTASALATQLGIALAWAGAALSAAFLAAMCILTCAEVVLRYAFSSPTAWSNDVIGLCMAGIVFSALPWITWENAHIAIPLVPDALPPGPRRVALAALGLVAAATLVGFCWLVMGVLEQHLARGTLTSGVVRVPRWWLSGGMFIGFGTAALAAFLRLAASPAER
jgi:TRAP-type C4-dicarboxylate transport system permease small subunit